MLFLRAFLFLQFIPELVADRPAPHLTLNLDEPPLQRWNDIAARYSVEIHAFYDMLRKSEHYAKMLKAAELIVSLEKAEERWFPKDQYLELKGLSKATSIPIPALAVLSLFYDLTAAGGSDSRACTSIIVENEAGMISHGRNLDYNLDMKSFMTNLTAVIDWQRGGKTLFSSVSFIGMIGFNTAVRHGAFSISHDERDEGSMLENAWDVFVRRRVATFSLLRQVAEEAESYHEAKQRLGTADLAAPSYFIVGGMRSGEGTIITRDREQADIFNLNASTGRWYIVETNYDHQKKPPGDDDRRDAAKRFLNSTGQKGFSTKEMLAALSNTAVGKGESPTLNPGTVYSAVLSARSSSILAVIRDREEQSQSATMREIIL